MKKTQNKPAAEESTSVRLDKWLWAARFFKTRTLSQDNIELGRIRMNGVRLKASKEIKIGDQLEIMPMPGSDYHGRPTKRDGRKIRQFMAEFDPSKDF